MGLVMDPDIPLPIRRRVRLASHALPIEKVHEPLGLFLVCQLSDPSHLLGFHPVSGSHDRQIILLTIADGKQSLNHSSRDGTLEPATGIPERSLSKGYRRLWMLTRPRTMDLFLWLAAPFLAMLFTAGPALARLANEGRNGLYVRSIPEVLNMDDSQVDLATAALIVSEKWSDVVQGLRYRDRLDEMALEIQRRLEAQGLAANHRSIPVINQYLFEEIGFTAVAHADNPNDLFLNSVMDNRRGYCLSLSVLYLSLGERLGLPLYGVVAPGHFFVRYDNGSVRFNIETTAGGAHPSDDHYRVANRVPEDDQGIYMRNLTKHQTLACLFNNFGVVYLDTNYLDLAVEALGLAVQIMPQLAEARVNLGNAYTRQERIDLALLQYREACRINPNDAKIRQALGDIYLCKNQPDLAVPQLWKAIDLDPNYMEGYIRLAVAYSHKEQFNRAREVLKQGILHHPGVAGLYSQLGEVYRLDGDCERAVESYQKAVAIQPKLVQANFGLGLCYNKLGMADQEILAYKRILAVEPSFLPAVMNLALAYVTHKDYPAAIVHYQKAIHLDPNHAGLHHNLGLAYAQIQDPNRAEAEFLKALELDSTLVGSHYWLGIHYSQRGRYQEAWKHLTRAKELGMDVKQELLDAIAARLPANKN